jgi:peptide methionine sulfoxide reductase msrA/msrB
VIDAESGYMGGKVDRPTYKLVCGGNTGHAETVKVVFDPKKVTFRQLAEAFFKVHDPTQVGRQGPNVGDQYRSAIFASDEQQLAEVKALLADMQKSGPFAGKRIATAVSLGGKFWPAEDYHQDYYEKSGGG